MDNSIVDRESVTNEEIQNRPIEDEQIRNTVEMVPAYPCPTCSGNRGGAGEPYKWVGSTLYCKCNRCMNNSFKAKKRENAVRIGGILMVPKDDDGLSVK